MKSMRAVHKDILMNITKENCSWNFHEIDMNVSWTHSVEMWSWYSYEIDVKSSFWNFLQYFITRLFMKFWWISYEHSRFPIHTENSCQILKKFIWPFHNEIGVYFTWKHSYEFHMNFSWIIHNIMKSTPYLEHPY